MKQIIQDLKSGDTILEEVPVPRVGSGKVLIKTHRSLVSLGTEKMLVNFGQANLIDKARQQPDRVKDVINKMKTDGIQPTVEAVFRKLGTPLPLGYSQAGTVVEVGNGVTEFKVGDRVVSNGNHAEFVAVPKNLVAKIPDNVSFDEASFTVVGAIGLQGVRLVRPTFGETIVVIGLGLIGLITVQLLKANGCNVIGIDLDQDKVDRAKSYGVEALNPLNSDPVNSVNELTGQIGCDGVIITASAPSNQIIKQAANMSRKRGRIVLVGVIGLNIERADFYEKELTFQVSCSYGPGRYDSNYEQSGHDYPLPFVRWTENRNFQAILEAIENGNLDVKSLITEEVVLEDYLSIYGDMNAKGSIASILQYPVESVEINRSVKVSLTNTEKSSGKIAVIGAGNFTQAMIMPALKNTNADIKYVLSSGGLSSTSLAKKYNVPISSTSFDEVLADSEVNHVVITTQHNLHAGMTIQALNAGKDVFVEKPLALKSDELNEIISAVEKNNKSVIVGFNRRFSPHILKMKKLLGNEPGPMNVIATMNAGFIPPEVWVHDMNSGGGRIIGEACHYIDLITCLTGSKIVEVNMKALGVDPKINTDNASIHLKYENGSLGVINYFANGHKSYSKERVEVYYQNKNLILDNFRRLDGYGYSKGLSSKLLKTKQDKGHFNQFNLLIEQWEKGLAPIIPFDEIVNTTKASFAAIDSLLTNETKKV
ncbi:bi-domain-containing oxidoreductase [Balneola vulgaris]|uniref:bi-domain-containing oxidoreductase n=1 Tax=Balneola vulgaris TaxID=287535 RepID=UPI000368D907|nr:bi-domain-containing oxidoreductase [Balneola vulgaris]